MIRSIIIDDEVRGREYLHGLIRDYCSGVQVVGKADSIDSGLKSIQEHRPNLVFLDVMMPGGTGFDLLDQVDTIDFEIIFTTAHDNYALRAIKFSALDYLLKPIDVHELQLAIAKMNAKNRIQPEHQKHVEVFLDNVKKPSGFSQMVLPTADGLIFIKLEDIIRCQGEGSYTRVYMHEEETVIVSRNLKEIEGLLSDNGFFRVHKSHLINLNHIRRYVKGTGGFVIMSDGAKVEIAKRKKDEFIEKLQ